MKTEDLIVMLARGPIAADLRTTERYLGLAAAAGAVAAALWVFVVLGPSPDIGSQWIRPGFWLKLALPALLAYAAFAACCRLARPGAGLGETRFMLAAPLVIAALALTLVLGTERTTLLGGHGARECIARIALLALPGLAAAFTALRSLTPTRLSAAGACAGLLAGAIAATVYAFHCGETRVLLVAVRDALGISIPVVVGTALGPRFLHWT